MRRIVYTATLSIFFFLATLAPASATTLDRLFGSVNATADSSGVSITISQSSVSLNGDTSGNISITVSNASTDGTLICTLDPGSADVEAHRQGDIDVTWMTNDGLNVTLVMPSIRIAGMLSNFTCERAD
jgi:hypothetical protein